MSPSFSIFARSWIFGVAVPGWLTPARSPLTSAMKTGTPMRLRFSAMTWRETVLPVPVAPAIRPCLLAMRGRRKTSLSPRAIKMGSDMLTSSVSIRGAKAPIVFRSPFQAVAEKPGDGLFQSVPEPGHDIRLPAAPVVLDEQRRAHVDPDAAGDPPHDVSAEDRER